MGRFDGEVAIVTGGARGMGEAISRRLFLAESGEVVGELYAAGRTACGLPRWGAGYSSGMSLADATFFGLQAGRAAAARR